MAPASAGVTDSTCGYGGPRAPALDDRWWWLHSRRSTGCRYADAGEISVTKTGPAGQQQLRSARWGGPGQRAWPPVASAAGAALRHGNLITAHHPWTASQAHGRRQL